MRGQTHYKLGILYYILICILPAAAVPIIFKTQFSFLGIGAAALGGLFPDIDCKNSLIYKRNPIFMATDEAVSILEQIFYFILKVCFTLIPGILIILNANKIIWEFQNYFEFQRLKVITYSLSIVFILTFFISKKLLKKLPFFNLILSCSQKTGWLLKKFIVFAFFFALGVLIWITNNHGGRDPLVYCIVGIIFLIPFLNHRCFSHSIEGIIVFTWVMNYFFTSIDYSELTIPFLIGYFSHLYLADIFTKEGIPLLFLPYFLRRVGIHKRLNNFGIYKVLDQIFHRHIRIFIEPREQRKANTFEKGYILSVIFAIIILVMNGQGLSIVLG